MALSSPARKTLWTREVAAAMLQQMASYRRDVGARLEGLRRAQNWSQEDAAHAVGVTTSTWGRWERGTTSPYESNWRRIAAAFGDEEARVARGQPPTPDGHDRLEDLEVVVAAVEEQVRLLRAEAAVRDAEVRQQIEEGVQTIRDLLPPPQP